MSMPSSRLDVATSAGRRPALSSSSIARRCSRAMLPWWARTSSSPASSLRRWASRSASRRLLVKTIVLRWLADQLEDPGVDRRPDARPQLARRRPGRRAARRAAGPRRARPCPRPGRRPGARAACARRRRRSSTSRPGPDAAEEAGDRLERPLRGGQADPLERRRRAGRGSRRRSRRSRLSARWAPRFVPAIAWTSSTMTCSTPRRISRACARQQQVERSRAS